MAKFKESELADKLKDYQKERKIEIELEKCIEGKLRLNEATVRYDYNNGYIYISSKEGDFKINTTLVYGYEEVKDEIQIDLDTILIKIRKVN